MASPGTYQAAETPQLPPLVRLTMEAKRRGMAIPAPIDRITSEYRRRSLDTSAFQDYGNDQFPYNAAGVEQAAMDRYNDEYMTQEQGDPGERQKYVSNRTGEWINKIEDTLTVTPGHLQQGGGERLTYDQRSRLYEQIGEAGFQKKRDEFGAQYDAENSPEARYIRDRDSYGNTLAANYRQAHPEATDSEVYNHMHRELARYGYNPSYAGQLGAVVDRRELAADLAQVQQATAPLVDQVPGVLQPGVALGAGAVKSFQDNMATFVGTIGAGGISEFLERTIGDDLGLRDQQAAIETYWSQTAGQNFVLGTTTQEGARGAALRFTETMGQVAGDLATTMVATSLGASGAKLAGLNARLSQLSGQLSGMGFMGAKEGGGAYRTIRDQLIAKGYSPEEANRRGLYGGIAVAVVNSLLEKAPIDAFVFANPQTINRLKGALRGLVVEGTQEAAQETVNILAEFESGAATAEVVSWDNARRLATAALAGSIVGGGLGVATGGAGARADVAQEAQDEARAEILARIDRAERAQRQAAQARESTQDIPDTKAPDEVPVPEVAPPTGTTKPSPRNDPKILPTGRRMTDWYHKTYGDTPSTELKQLVDNIGERFQLVEVPAELFTGDPNQEVNPEDATAISKLSPQEIADLPPLIAFGNTSGQLQVVDGNKRLAGLRMTEGVATIKSYVPASVAKEIAAGTFQPTAEPVTPEGEARPEPVPPEGGEGPRPTEEGQGPDAEPKPGTPQWDAKALGIEYAGQQFAEDGIRIIGDQFTDPQTGTTFLVKTGEDPRLALIAARKRFQEGAEKGQPKDPRVRNLKTLAEQAIKGGDVESMRGIQKRLDKLRKTVKDPYGASSERAKDTLRQTQELIDALETEIGAAEPTARPEERGPEAEKEAAPPTGEKAEPTEEPSRAERAEEAFEREYDLARRDPLTGIANLRKANEQMQDMMDLADKEGKTMAVGGIDLVLFKQVNDYLGHAAGDKALVAAAKALEDSVRSPSKKRPGDTFGIVARLGGDEFEFALYDVTPQQAQMVGERMQAAYLKAMADQGVELPGKLKTMLGFGYAIREPGSTQSIESLRQVADANLEGRKAELKAREGLPGRAEAEAIIKRQREHDKAKAEYEAGQKPEPKPEPPTKPPVDEFQTPNQLKVQKELQGKIAHHFTTPEAAAKLLAGEPFDQSNEPQHKLMKGKSGEVDTGGRFAPGEMYLSLDDERWGTTSDIDESIPAVEIGMGKDDPKPTEDDAPFYDYEKQKWMMRPGALKRRALTPVQVRIKPNAKILVLDSPEAVVAATQLFGPHDTDAFWERVKAFSPNYDAVAILNSEKYRERNANKGWRFFDAAGGDQVIVLNQDAVEVVRPTQEPPDAIRPGKAEPPTPPEAEAEPEAEVTPEGEPEEGRPTEPADEALVEQETSVPGAQYWFYPPEDAKAKAQQEKIRKEFEKEGPRPRRVGPTKKKVPGPKKLPKPASNRPARLKAVSMITKAAPFERQAVFIDEGGKRLASSDGSTMVRVTNESESWGDDGAHGIDKSGLKPAMTESRFVNQILPALDELLAGYDKKAGAKTATLDIDEVANQLRRVTILADDADAPGGATVGVNPDGTLGFAKGGRLGHAEINVQEGVTVLPVGIDPARMLEAMEFMNAMGVKTVEVFANNVDEKGQPFIFRAMTPQRYVTVAIAPMHFQDKAKPKVVAEEEIEEEEGGPIAGAPSGPTIAKGRGFNAATGQPAEPTPAKPPKGYQQPLSSKDYTSDAQPLTDRPGAFRRTPSDVGKKIKAKIAAARARRDGEESLDLDNIYRIIEDTARRFGLGPPGIGRARALAQTALGFYKIEGEAIRLRRGSYVSTFVHELGHHLHKILIPRGRRPSKKSLTSKRMEHISAYDFPKVWRKELIVLGKDLYGDRDPNVGGYTTEGWAEVIRFLIINPAHLKKRAPNVYQGVVESLVANHPDTWLGLMDARVRLINSILISRADPIDQFIAHDDGPSKFSYRNLIDDVRSRLFDRFQRLVTFKKDLALDDLPAHLDPHTMALRANGHISGDIKLAMERGTFDPKDPARKKTGKGLVEILEPVKKSLREWQNYMTAKRVIEKRAQGYSVFPTDPMMADIKSRALGPADQQLFNQTTTGKLREYIARAEAAHPEFEQASKDFQEFNQWLIGEYAVGYGLVSEEAALMIMAKNLEYITFRHKKVEDAIAKKYGIVSSRGGFTGQGSGIRRFRAGKGEQIVPPLESFLASMQGIMSRARLNQVAQGVLRHASIGTPGAGRWADSIDRPMEAAKVSAERLGAEYLKQMGIGLDRDGGLIIPEYLQSLNDKQMDQLLASLVGLNAATFWKPGNRVDRDNREVTVLHRGKPKFFEIKDKRLYDMLEGLNNPYSANLLTKVIGKPGRVLRAGATQYNPSFFIPNFSRDFMQAVTMTQSEMRKLPEQARLRLQGMREAFTGGDIHELFLASGADMSGIFGEYYDARTQKLDFNKMFEKPRRMGLVKGENIKGTIRDLVKLGAVDRLNRSFELANRLGEFAVVYEQAKRRGAEEAEAIAEAGQAAADVTLDFQRGGTWSKQVNEVIVFFNAAMLGADKLGRFIKNDPPKALGRIMAFTILPSIITMLLNYDNEDYWAKPKRMRDRYWYIPTGDDNKGRQTYVRFPKPYGLGAFSIATERSFARAAAIDPESGERGDPRAMEGWVLAMIGELRPTLNIAGIQPLIEVMAGDQGWSFYRDHEIVSSADKDLPLGEQGASRSSDFARALGRLMDYPPAKIDYLIQGWTGGLGRDAVQVAIDPLIRQIDPEAKIAEPMEFNDWLIVRRFLAGQTRSGHEALTRFYDDYDRLKKINRGLTSREDTPKRHSDYAKRYASQLDLWRDYTAAQRDMGDLFKDVRALYRNRTNMDADRFSNDLDRTLAEIVDIAQETHRLRRRSERKKRK